MRSAMKFPLKLTRSPHSQSPLTTEKPLFPLPPLGRSSSKKVDGSNSCERSEAPSLTPPLSSSSPCPSFSRSFPVQKARVSTSSCPSPSDSAYHPHHGDLSVSEAQIYEIQQVFTHFDTNGDGKISVEELRAVLASLGESVTSEEAALMVREVDLNGDGYIDLGEFMELNGRCWHSAMAEEEMAAAFAVFDVGKNGRITAEGLQEVLHRLGGSAGGRASAEDCKRMIGRIDRKGRGHVDLDDFKHMMSPLTF